MRYLKIIFWVVVLLAIRGLQRWKNSKPLTWIIAAAVCLFIAILLTFFLIYLTEPSGSSHEWLENIWNITMISVIWLFPLFILFGFFRWDSQRGLPIIGGLTRPLLRFTRSVTIEKMGLFLVWATLPWCLLLVGISIQQAVVGAGDPGFALLTAPMMIVYLGWIPFVCGKFFLLLNHVLQKNR